MATADAKSTLTLIRRLDDPATASGPAHALRATVCLGPDAGKTFSEGKSLVVVGRGEAVDIRLADPAVSQFHVELHATAAGIVVRDLGSRNGVWYSGARIEHGTVPSGAALSLGGSTLRVEQTFQTAKVPSSQSHFGHLVGRSPRMRDLYPLLTKLAHTDISVLIEGDTGTGKGEVARALYENSMRAGKPFVVLDSTLLPEALAPSLLFGHERGAFTGAVDKRIGAFESAHGGVLFMDEVGELSPAVQAMLLRAVQYRQITPVGSNKSRPVDVRIICATWRDLRSLVNTGAFREDLYYRLAGATVRLPSLAERTDDVPLLVESFLSNLPSDAQAARSIAPEALAALSQRRFPGNIRQLQSLVDRLARLAAGPTITIGDLAMEQVLSGLRERTELPGPSRSQQATAGSALPLYLEAKQTAMEEFERGYLQQLFARAGSNLSRAASLAGIQRHNLRALLRKHGLYRGEPECQGNEPALAKGDAEPA